VKVKRGVKVKDSSSEGAKPNPRAKVVRKISIHVLREEEEEEEEERVVEHQKLLWLPKRHPHRPKRAQVSCTGCTG
jgi:hypothetical protein